MTEKDLATVLEWRNAPEIRRASFSQHEIRVKEHRAWFEAVSKNPQSHSFIHLNDEGAADGVVNFTNCKPRAADAFWGFYAAPGSPPGTGSRLGLDALDTAFTDLELHKLNAEVIAANESSLKFHEKLGFVREGTLRDFFFDGNEYHAVHRLGILEPEWAAARPRLMERI
ncbi:MAG: UDP-4-amino-4,6-dideoxy-N-acetyl-beta-L-altrosamine N-acetyltransferase [Gammaproteobacteria bacterium]